MSAPLVCCGPEQLPTVGKWGAPSMVSPTPCRISGRICSVSFCLNKAPEISAVAGGGLRLNVFDFIDGNISADGSWNRFRLIQSVRIPVSSDIVNHIQEIEIPQNIPIKLGQYVGLVNEGGALNIASRHSNRDLRTTIFFSQTLPLNDMGSVVKFKGYSGSDHRGHTSVGFHIKVLGSNTDHNVSETPSGMTAGGNTVLLGLYPLPADLTATWKDSYMMPNIPVPYRGKISRIGLWLGKPCSTSQSGRLMLNLLIFRKTNLLNELDCNFVLKTRHSLYIDPINCVATQECTLTQEAFVERDDFICLQNPGGQLNFRSRSVSCLVEQRLYYRGINENLGQSHYRFLTYKNADARGKTCASFYVNIDQAPQPVEPNRVRVNSNRANETGIYCGLNPLPQDLQAAWNDSYLMSDQFAPTGGQITELNIWLGKPSTTLGPLKLMIFSKVLGHQFKLSSSHDIPFDPVSISSVQTITLEPSRNVRVLQGQYICLHAPMGSLNMRSRSITSRNQQQLYFKARVISPEVYEFKMFTNSDHRGKTCAGFNAKIVETSTVESERVPEEDSIDTPHTTLSGATKLVTDLVIGPHYLPTVATWKMCTMLGEKATPHDGHISKLEIAIGQVPTVSANWQLHAMSQNPVKSFQFKSERHISFLPPREPGNQIIHFDNYLRVRQGEYLCLFSGSADAHLLVRSRFKKDSRSITTGQYEELLYYGATPNISNYVDFKQYKSTDNRGMTTCAFRAYLTSLSGPMSGRVHLKTPSQSCQDAFRNFIHAKNEEELLWSIQTLANFNASGIDRSKLIAAAGKKIAMSNHRWTKDVATCFGALICTK